LAKDVVVLGGGHAGLSAVVSLRADGFDGGLTLVSAEPHLPYQRPPLSKAFLKAPADPPLLKPESFFVDNDIQCRLGVAATAIDRATPSLQLDDGTSLPFDKLIYACGSRNRPLPSLSPDLENVFGLKTLDEASSLHNAVSAGAKLTVIGGGFIGAEVAATARSLSCEVTVLEFAPRLMARACSPGVSAYFLSRHQAAGIDVRLETGASGFRIDGKRVTAVETTTGDTIPTDVLLVCVGVLPNSELAEAAGIATANGVTVDAYLATPDAHVLAIGDCASFPYAPTGEPVRIESVQNATDQGRAAARTVLGDLKPYDAVPWFWSDQGDDKLQMVGLSAEADTSVTRGDVESGRFSVWNYSGATLVGMEAVNRPADYMLARRLMEAGITPPAETVADADANLKALLPR